jgi:hypothetical protein
MGINTQTEEHEAYLEIPLSHYVVIGQTAIHKKVFLFSSAIAFFFGIALLAVAEYTNWYSVLGAKLSSAYTTNWIVTVPLTLVTLTISYLYLNSKRKRNRKRK